MHTSNLMSVAVAIPETWTKFQNLNVSQCDFDYDPFNLLFTAYFYSLQSVYVLNLKPIASAVREIFTGVCKFKI